jgi:hypothetical protein
MNQRNLLILIAILAFVGLAAWLVSPRDEARLGEGKRLLPGLSQVLSEVERVTVRRGGNETLATLVPTEAGWVVQERDGYPANFSRLRQNLRGLAEAQIFEAKTANPEFYERLGVRDIADEEATGTEFDIQAGDYSGRVIVGSTDVGGGSLAYVRRADEAQSYLVRASLDPGRSITDWLDTAIVDISSARVRAVQIRQPDGEILAIAKPRTESANYTVADVPAGRTLTYEGVANSIGAALAGLKLDDVEPASTADTGDTEPTVATFETFDGLTVEVQTWALSDKTVHAFSATAQLPPVGETPLPDEVPPAMEAPATAGDTPEGNEPNDAVATEDDGPSDAEGLAKIEAEAQAINDRVGGWLYTVPAFKAEQFTRRMDDLLAAPE